ncbi:DUF2938 domain-containing protein [Marinomonas sp. C2222]|uniref:DUF2938 domain-containing protein n=1 Tax=Marinomonas sargassi TaxID=2984494 RepID=A0ABT2YUE4_9GAMM|nr:DUF2938 domain-containing protein [Marinomonas sargassi]MCV2403400.1 DUF2938 domain-containing protein [Marinomonas sargassi]
MKDWLLVLCVGIGATLIMDIWGLLRKPLLGSPFPNYAFVGRWIMYMPRGVFHHTPISGSAPMKGEHLVGWIIHYLTGIAFAVLLTTLWGSTWLQNPTLAPAILVGVGTIIAPFLLMQPAMGSGIASSKTKAPNSARLQSLITHIVFGLGLYVSGLIVKHTFSL